MGQFLLVEPRHIPDCPIDWNDNLQQRLYLERFNAVTNLFLPGTNLDEYSLCVSKLKGLPELSNFKQKAAIAFTILFDCDENTTIGNNFSNIDHIFNYYVRTCDNCISFTSFIENLKEMAKFSTRNIAW